MKINISNCNTAEDLYNEIKRAIVRDENKKAQFSALNPAMSSAALLPIAVQLGIRIIIDEDVIINKFTTTIQNKLDSVAQSRGYDNIFTLCTYANSTNQTFKTEGEAGVAWRDACWLYCQQVLAAVKAGQRAIPLPSELIEELPAINW